VRVRLEGCGVCASNIPPFEGREWFTYPMAPGALGHEGWGVVDAVGEGVTGVAVGDRVASLGQKAYAEFDTVPAADVLPLPASLAGVPLPGEPLGCALNIFARSGVTAGQTVAVVGVGFLGALLVRLAKDAGARVIAVARRPFARDVARRFGADATIALEEPWRVVEQVKALTGEELCPVVIEATGKQGPLDVAAELTGVRGRLVIAGYHQDGLRTANLQLWNWRGFDVINAHERDPQMYRDGAKAAIEAVASGRLDPSPLYTHVLPLDRLGEALELTRDRPDGFVKALVTLR
jgi:threonine dehydrogenase-like Zn-dependent dehydrogenase